MKERVATHDNHEMLTIGIHKKLGCPDQTSRYLANTISFYSFVYRPEKILQKLVFRSSNFISKFLTFT